MNVEYNLNFCLNYVVPGKDLNIIIWIKERFCVFKNDSSNNATTTPPPNLILNFIISVLGCQPRHTGGTAQWNSFKK